MSVTEQARRAQIVAAAIDTIAAEGYARASFARIARAAGLSSTGLISYHFASKQDLMDAVVRTVLGEFGAFVTDRMNAESGPAGELRAFIAANIAFVKAHRTRLLAALAINAAGAAGRGEGTDPLLEADIRGLAELLRAGQRTGEFRDFDVDVMAVAIRSVRDGVLNRLSVEPDLDLDTYTGELVTLFDLATRGNT
jgi:AcrR family transcriptional regulator